MPRLLRSLALLLLTALPAQAQECEALGWGHVFTNDGIGDGQDRWRTVGLSLSHLRGPEWSGQLPESPGALLEFRARAEILAPANLASPAPGDRRYAGVLSFGLHTHFQHAGWQSSLGIDLALTGPQTGLGNLQDAIHDALGVAVPAADLLDDQIPDALHPTLVYETGRELPLGAATLRPFVEAQAGIETFARIGFDLVVGRFGQGGLLLREASTGQRYAALPGAPGLSLTLGGDTAHVFDSALFPKDGPEVLESRHRLRAGLAWQGGTGAQAFYGLTWLSEEFEGQDEGQILGTLSLKLQF